MATRRHVFETFRLDGRIALVTGGARGLGMTMATALAEAGADVAIAGRSRESCQPWRRRSRATTGRRASAFVADVTDRASIERLAVDIEGELGPVDILVNNAGINIRGPIQDLTEDDFDSVIRPISKGPFLCSREFGPRMVKRGWGRVINMGSILSVIAMPGRTPYASSKAGVLNLTRVLALEWAGTGVTSNAICPGPFGTELNRSLLDDPVKYKEFVGTDSDGPMGRGSRARRRRRVSGVGSVVVHDGQRALRRRRLDGEIVELQSSKFKVQKFEVQKE